MDNNKIAESMCFTIQLILRAIEARHWMSIPRLCIHLYLTAYYAAVQEERYTNPPIIINPPDDCKIQPL